MPRISHNELSEELAEEEALQNEFRYGTSAPKLVEQRKAQEAAYNAQILKDIQECREQMDDEEPLLQRREDFQAGEPADYDEIGLDREEGF